MSLEASLALLGAAVGLDVEPHRILRAQVAPLHQGPQLAHRGEDRG